MTELLSGRVSVELGARKVLDRVEIAIGAGECLAVVGPNGAGKTTLLRTIAGVLKPTAGELSIRSRPYRRLSRRELARSIAYVPQVRPARVPLSVRDVVLLGRYPHSRRWSLGYERRDHRAVRSALETAGLLDLADRPITELSGGERQAVYIAAALAQETECLLLDEPTTYLDPGHQRQVTRVLDRLRRTQERTVIFASHDLNLAFALADRVLALSGGCRVAWGPTEEVLTPRLLEDLYGAPFLLSRSGERSVVSVDLDPSGVPGAGEESV